MQAPQPQAEALVAGVLARPGLVVHEVRRDELLDPVELAPVEERLHPLDGEPPHGLGVHVRPPPRPSGAASGSAEWRGRRAPAPPVAHHQPDDPADDGDDQRVVQVVQLLLQVLPVVADRPAGQRQRESPRGCSRSG